MDSIQLIRTDLRLIDGILRTQVDRCPIPLLVRGLTFHAPILVIPWHGSVSSVCEDFLDLSSKKVVEGVDDVPAFTHVRGFVPEDGQLMPRCKTSIPLIDVFDSQPIGAFLGGERRNLASMISLYVKKDFFHTIA